jgi:hypothetical protein
VDKRWVFEQDEQLQWRWVHRRGDVRQGESAQSFERPMDCVLDAVRHAVLRRRAMSEVE